MAEKKKRAAAAKDKPAKKKGGILKKLLFAIMGLLVAGGSGVAVYWFFYLQGTPTMEEGEVPVIEAEENPFKVKPDNPEGMEFAHRDSTAYDAIEGRVEEGAGDVVMIQDPPELPTEPAFDDALAAANPYADDDEDPLADAIAALPDGMDPDSPEAMALMLRRGDEVVEETGVMIPQSADEVMATAPIAAPAAAAIEPDPVMEIEAEMAAVEPEAVTESVPQTPAVVTPVPAPAPAPVPVPVEDRIAAVAQAVTTASVASSLRIQLGSLRTNATAEREWRRLAEKNKDILSGLSMYIERADLGAKGIFHRVQAGPVASEADARALCTTLKARNVGCLIVRP